MLRNKKNTKTIKTGMIETLIGDKTQVDGVIIVSGTTRIDGIVKGAIQCDGTLIIGETGKLEGDGAAQNVLVAGKVIGNLEVAERVELTKEGVITGDVVTKILMIAEGAVFNGSCTMIQREAILQDGEEVDGQSDADLVYQEAAMTKSRIKSA